jgi:hypothetical protein
MIYIYSKILLLNCYLILFVIYENTDIGSVS